MVCVEEDASAPWGQEEMWLPLVSAQPLTQCFTCGWHLVHLWGKYESKEGRWEFTGEFLHSRMCIPQKRLVWKWFFSSFFELTSFNGLCAGPDAFLSLFLPCFTAGAFCPLQAAFPRLLCLWLLSGFGHRLGTRRGTGAGRSPLCVQQSPQQWPVSWFRLPAGRSPTGPASLDTRSARAPGMPLPLSLWLRVLASCPCQFLGSPLPCLASQLFHPLCNQFPVLNSLSLKYSNGLFPG